MWGKVGLGEGLGVRFHVMRGGGRRETLQDRIRDADIDHGGRGILRNESNGCSDLCRDFSGRSILLFNSQPRSIDLARSISRRLGYNAKHRDENHTIHLTSQHSVPRLAMARRGCSAYRSRFEYIRARGDPKVRRILQRR